MDAFVDGSSIETETQEVEEYGDEVMYAGWNPQLALAGDGPVAQINKHADLPADLVNVDIDAFLKRMYEYQC
ncbi:MAG: hypothetical protein HZB47_09255 [Nitrosomonadales bacterium]|nr:hypothetical protein [Nitrosomonadales bacterium]